MPKIRAAAKEHGVDMSEDDDGTRSLAPDSEWRYTPGVVELRSVEGRKHIGGYAAVFEKLSRNLGGFVEKVAPSAFNQSRQLGYPGTVCRLNHDRNQLLGTAESRTLTLRIDNVGLDYDVEPPQFRHDVVELVERGDIRNSSFAFKCPRGGDEWRKSDQGYPLRILHEVELEDVSPVTEMAAYREATAGLRSLAAAMDAPFEEVRTLAAADGLRKFFERTDNRAAAKPAPVAEALVRLMDKRIGPHDGK
jgi:HK97 family phage prohead protease